MANKGSATHYKLRKEYKLKLREAFHPCLRQQIGRGTIANSNGGG